MKYFRRILSEKAFSLRCSGKPARRRKVSHKYGKPRQTVTRGFFRKKVWRISLCLDVLCCRIPGDRKRCKGQVEDNVSCQGCVNCFTFASRKDSVSFGVSCAVHSTVLSEKHFEGDPQSTDAETYCRCRRRHRGHEGSGDASEPETFRHAVRAERRTGGSGWGESMVQGNEDAPGVEGQTQRSETTFHSFTLLPVTRFNHDEDAGKWELEHRGRAAASLQARYPCSERKSVV